MSEFTKAVARWYDNTIAGRHKIEACDLMVDTINSLAYAHTNIAGLQINSSKAKTHLQTALDQLKGVSELTKDLVRERRMFGSTFSMGGAAVIPSRNGPIDLRRVKALFSESKVISTAEILLNKVDSLESNPEAYRSNTPGIANSIADLMGTCIEVLKIMDPGSTRASEIRKPKTIVANNKQKASDRALMATAKNN